MRIALTHKYNKEKQYFILEKNNITFQDMIKVLAKLLVIECSLDQSSSIYIKKIIEILINNLNFSSDLKEYQYKDIRKMGKIYELDFWDIKENFNDIEISKDKNAIYKIDMFLLWEIYICGENYIEFEKEIEEHKDGLTGKLYKTIYKGIFKEKMAYFKRSIAELKEIPKSEKLKKWFQEEENGEKI